VRVSLWRAHARLRQPIAAATQRHDERTRLYLELAHAGHVGYGEISPQTVSLNGDSGVEEIVGELVEVVLPRLMRVVGREHEPPAWARATSLVGERPESRFAGALLEMALMDRELRARDSDLATLWPAQFATPIQSTVSMINLATPWSVGDAARVRVKTAPGALSDAALAALAGLSVPVLLDFNCSATSAEEVLSQWRSISEVARVDAIEQPFAPGNVAAHARLAAHLGVDLSIDEGCRSLQDLVQIVRYQAASMICVKPARVGGYAVARSLITRAREMGLRVYLGGFFESDFARFVNRTFAQSCVEEPSDVGGVDLVDGGAVELAGGLGWRPAPAVLEAADLVGTWQ
jgi:o-succinylbenzoate synthase